MSLDASNWSRCFQARGRLLGNHFGLRGPLGRGQLGGPLPEKRAGSVLQPGANRPIVERDRHWIVCCEL